MKIVPRFKTKDLIVAAAFVAGLGLGPSASAQLHPYLIDLNSKTVTNIGTLGGTEESSVSSINEAG